jgi:hypothetical protein
MRLDVSDAIACDWMRFDAIGCDFIRLVRLAAVGRDWMCDRTQLDAVGCDWMDLIAYDWM